MRSARCWKLALVAACVLARAGLAADLEPAEGGLQWGFGSGSVAAEAARKPAKEPAYASEKPLYLSLELGSGEDRLLLGALDESKGTGKGYDTLYLDANRDSDLTNDPRPQASRSTAVSGQTMLEFARLPVTVQYRDGTKRVLPISLSLYGFRRGEGEAAVSWFVRWRLLQHWEGSVELGGKKRAVRLYDAGNGCFDDFGRDCLDMDLDADGRLAPDERMPLSRIILVDGKPWELEVAGSGSRLSVKPYAGGSGRVRFRFGFAEGVRVTGGSVLLGGAEGCFLALKPAEEEPGRVPAGTFEVVQGGLELQDGDGVKWTARFKGPSAIRVEAEGMAEVRLGAPFKLEPVVEGELRPGGRAEISRRVAGAAGEVYSLVYSQKGQPPAPEVSIKDAGGAEIVHGKMRYG